MEIKSLKKFVLDARQEIKHKNKERLCFCCNTLQESKNNIKTFKVNNRGYGSIYNGDKFKIQLCQECAKKVQAEWFDEEPLLGEDGVSVYLLEGKINDFIENEIIIIENLEYIYNCENSIDTFKVDRKDWIRTEKASRMIKAGKLKFI